MRFRFDTISFFLGMGLATLAWWVISLLSPIINQWITNYKKNEKDRTKKTSSDIEIAYLKALQRHTQKMHLAASIFALDEIIEIPRFMVSPITHEDHTNSYDRDIIEDALPFLPNFPELGAFYNTPSLTLAEALAGGANLAIIGQPGMGKSTALAFLASQMTTASLNGSPISQLTPFLIHVADLGLHLNNIQKPEDLLTPLSENITQYMRVFDGPLIPKFISGTFASGKALLLLDGVDELSQTSLHEVNNYLLLLIKKYPKTRLVLTGSPEYLDCIQTLGLFPLSIMPWGIDQQTHFINNWSSLWGKYVTKETWIMNTIIPVNSTLLTRWLSTDNFGLTPMELSLKIWGAFAGDISTGHPADIMEAHIRRLTPAGIPPEALNMLGLQTCLNGSFWFDGNRAREWTKSYEPVEAHEPSGNESVLESSDTSINNKTDADTSEITEWDLSTKKDRKKKTGTTPQKIASSGLIPKLISSGLIKSHYGGRLRFAHPAFMGLLAGKGLAMQQVDTAPLLNQPPWAGQSICIQYLASFGDVSSVVNNLLAKEDPILLRPRFIAAKMLRYSRQPRETTWRGDVMASMVHIIQDEDNPLGLRGSAMAGLALSGDNNVSTLFRQLLNAPSEQVSQLAALATGFLRDTKSIELLSSLAAKQNEATRQAACLALVGIGSGQALEAVAIHLLRGDERLRIYAAQALANNSGDGREALREGIISEDILVRRAVVYGLARVPETWATELLEKTQINDEQWAVRNIAIEFLNARTKPDHRIPKPLLAPHENPWIIEFAGKHGLGVTPDQPATDILLQALMDSNHDLFAPALNYLRTTPSESVLVALYHHLFETNHQDKEAVFQTLSAMALGGTTLPDPRQFGLG